MLIFNAQSYGGEKTVAVSGERLVFTENEHDSGVSEEAARLEQELCKAEEHKLKEEAERAEKEWKEAKERAAQEERECKEAEEHAAREEEERKEAEERAAREACEAEERKKELLRLEEPAQQGQPDLAGPIRVGKHSGFGHMQSGPAGIAAGCGYGFSHKWARAAATLAPTSAKGKAKANASEHLVTTQREPPATPSPDTALALSDDQFTVVTRKWSRKGKGKAKNTAPQTVQAANTSVPSSSAAATQSARQTAKVPARPIYKPPTPPTWKEAPVIHKQHVATDLECAAALRRIFRRELTADDLRSVHVAWGGHESDKEATALWTLHFKWAVKYGLPLTVEQAKCRIVKESTLNEEDALRRFDEDWGPVGPRTYLFSTIPQEQYFAQPGDLEEVELPAETVQHNRNMARTLVNTIIQFKQLEAKANGTPPSVAAARSWHFLTFGIKLGKI
ncbi:hypothetical protein EDB86DRAFT_3084647 [Lactarius hatsudake]|nr:hypothetical protein EDB86DRAFT_3084647 [Lactarius hatsudake]